MVCGAGQVQEAACPGNGEDSSSLLAEIFGDITISCKIYSLKK